MKCAQCSKIIPDGLCDCPWCGAGAAAPSGTVSGRLASSESAGSSGHRVVLAISVVTSGLLFLVLSYFATSRITGPVNLENWDAFLGRCLGALLVAGLLVFVYGKIRNATLGGTLRALVVLTLSSLLTLLTLAFPARPRMGAIDPETVHRYSDRAAPPRAVHRTPRVSSKWDAAARSLMQDVQARNQQYLAEISSLDENSKPLYTIESFRDAASIELMIEQLHARIAVADKYTDWQPVFSKMKDYIARVDAPEDEKRQFLANYESTLPQTLSVSKAISDREHAWLQASLDLYQFALSKEGAFDWLPEHLSFRSRADSETFRRKFVKARTLNQEFLKAYWEVRQAQEAMMAELGLSESAPDSSRAP